jgi:hypothetical protein
MIINMVHGCDARTDHATRVAKRPIKIRNEKGQNGYSGPGASAGDTLLTNLNYRQRV